MREENQASKQGKEVLCHVFHWSSVQCRRRNWQAQCICKPTARNLIITFKAYSKVKMFVHTPSTGCDSFHNVYVIYKWCSNNSTPVNHSIFEILYNWLLEQQCSIRLIQFLWCHITTESTSLNAFIFTLCSWKFKAQSIVNDLSKIYTWNLRQSQNSG